MDPLSGVHLRGGGVHEVWQGTLCGVYRRLASDDGLVPLRARVRSEILDALHEEALTRRVPPGRLLAEMLAEFLPVAAADRVRRQMAPARPLRVVPGDVSKSDDTPVCRDAPQPALPASTNSSAPAVYRGTLNDFLQTSSSNSIQLDVPMKGTLSDGCT